MVDADKAKRLQQVLDECLRRRATGERLGDAEVIASHPDLMPELEKRLAALRLIEQAGRHADEGEASSSAPKLHIEGRCPDCQVRWRIKAEHAGRRLRCKKCGQTFAADEASSAAAGMEARGGSHASTPGLPLSIPGYEIQRELGRGGMGVVYRARELATKRTVALKLMLEGRHADPRQRRRFEREVEIAAALQHPHIARVYASGLHEGRHWFAMEYVEGAPLGKYAAKEELDVDGLLPLFASICHAVNHAHQRGIMHRDLKPGNILVDEHAQPRVLDFGLAKLTDRLGESEASISMSGEVAGTPAYMSPEQTKGDPSRIDVRSDVYSLGVILYRLLTGQSPYGEQKGLSDLLRAINDVEPPSPRRIKKEIPDEVEAIVLKALRKDPGERYQTAGELARDVEAYLAGDVVTAKRGSGWYTLRKTAVRYKGPAAVVTTVIVLSLGLGLTMSALFAKKVIEYRDVVREVEVYREREATRNNAVDEQVERRMAEEHTITTSRDWPHWRGPNHDGVSSETDLQTQWEATPPVVWQREIGSGHSAITCAGDKVFTCGTRDKQQVLFCLDADTGSVLWRRPIEKEYGDKQGGDGPRGTPTVDEGQVYVQGAQGRLICCETGSGKVIWEHSFESRPQWGYSGSVLIEGDLAIAIAGDADGPLVALNKENGELVWKAGSAPIGYSTPLPFTFEGRRYIAGLLGGSFIIVDPKTGREVWSMPWETKYDVNAATPIYHDGHVFFSSGYGHGSTLLRLSHDDDKLNGGTVWQGEAIRARFQTPVLYQGHLYTSDEVKLKCVEFATGREKWSKPRVRHGTTIIADGHLFVLTERGKLLIGKASPGGFEPTTDVPLLEGRCWTVPTLYRGRLFVRDSKQIVCLRLVR